MPGAAPRGLSRLVGRVSWSRARTRDLAQHAAGAAVEAGWVAAHAAMYPLGLLHHAAAPRRLQRYDLAGLSPAARGLFHHDVDAAATPILLVHGIVDNHSVFAVLQRALLRRGFSTIGTFDDGLLTSDIPATARDLAQAIEELTTRSGYDRVHVIGHSLGGLIARYYVQRMGGDARVRTLVTLGTPHAGSRRASIGGILPLARQLRPDSALITDLAQPAPGCTTRFVAFYSDLDELIVPSENARIDHPDLLVRNVPVRGVGHLALVNHGGIAHQIAALLRELDPAGD